MAWIKKLATDKQIDSKGPSLFLKVQAQNIEPAPPLTWAQFQGYVMEKLLRPLRNSVVSCVV